ncbi:hypothetical protein F4808DRAFT_78568 [Astrocystis sublimbata]|nr:hypothetical protein F4808DRAFT_78568 [Astrocystis sublimbata]
MAHILGLNGHLWQFCENYVYRIPEPPPRTRERPMEVLCVGLSRSGTESLARALDILGYTTYHGWDLLLEEPTRSQGWMRLIKKKYYGAPGDELRAADFDAEMGHANAVIEKVAYFFAPELAAVYPEAKVVLNRRSDLDKWSRSMENTVVPLTENWLFYLASWFDARTFWSYHLNIRWMAGFTWRNPADGLKRSLRGRGKWVYRDHCNMIKGTIPPERLLEWTVDDGWGPLCEFLGKEIPNEPFPHVNSAGTEFETKAARFMSLGMRNATRNFLIVAATLTSAVYAWLQIENGGLAAFSLQHFDSCLTHAKGIVGY